MQIIKADPILEILHERCAGCRFKNMKKCQDCGMHWFISVVTENKCPLPNDLIHKSVLLKAAEKMNEGNGHCMSEYEEGMMNERETWIDIIANAQTYEEEILSDGEVRLLS